MASTNPASTAAASYDRSSIGEKTRVHQLAKQLGVQSKELISVLDGIGLVKVAQSSLSREEVEKTLDALAPKKKARKTTKKAAGTKQKATKKTTKKAAKKAPKAAAAEVVEDSETEKEPKKTARRATRRRRATTQVDAEALASSVEDPADAKLVKRVAKNVENEIHQIEQKVERDLGERITDKADEDAEGTVWEEKDGLLHEVVPEVTPAPQSELPAVTPIFMPPEPLHSDDDDLEIHTLHVDKDTKDTEEQSDGERPRRRGKRGAGRGRGVNIKDAPEEVTDEPTAIKGSTRLEAQRRRRSEMREEGRKKRHIVSEAEFLARRESVKRTMLVREKQREDHAGLVTQVGVLEDGLLVEHFVTSETQTSMVGNVYLGRVQNVLPSMEAAFIDIGKGRNGVLYAGEVDWRNAGLGGRSRKIEQALKPGDPVLVQVAKDPIGHKGARLTTQISLAGRFLVYVPGGHSAGISRKLPESERKRLKQILHDVVPKSGGAIIRTAAEGVHEKAIEADVNRLHSLWEQIQASVAEAKKSKSKDPVTLYEEPDLLVKVIRDLFNEDFDELVVQGKRSWSVVRSYVSAVAPELMDRVHRFEDRDVAPAGEQESDGTGHDVFKAYRVEEQLHKALSEKVWLPSGGTLIIERTEAMTVIDVNTGKFTGSGGNLEETVTKNNLEAAEEIVRQMRLRDLGGMIVIDFIDMVLPQNQDLVLRRLKEALGRDRTRHQVSEVTSLGLVQVTRKRLGTGLLETFATKCEACDGRGVIIHDDPVDESSDAPPAHAPKRRRPIREDAPKKAEKAEKSEDAQQEDKAPKAEGKRRGAGRRRASIEELVDAVIVVSDDADSAGTQDAEAEKKDKRPARKNSRRRAGRKEEHADSAEPSISSIVSAALDVADAEDPDEPSGAQYRPAETFEEATEQFEKSPRRRRKTRGNSRSDHAPKREDFEAKPDKADQAAEPQRAEEESKPSDSQRRRARRAKKVSLIKREDGVKAEDKATKPEAKKPAEKEEPRRGRGRRRVVKKISSATQSDGQETRKQRSAAPKSEPVAPKIVAKKAERPSPSGRRRRRVVVKRSED